MRKKIKQHSGAPAMILESQQSDTVFKADNEFEVGCATKPMNKDGSSYAMQMRLPCELLSGMDDPKRIVIAGTPHEGFTITGTKDKHEGLAVNYKSGNGQWIWMTLGFKQMKLTKVRRRLTAARARISEGVMKIGGLPEGWINGTNEYLDDGTDRRRNMPPLQPMHARLPVSPISGAIAQPNGAGHHGNGHDQPQYTGPQWEKSVTYFSPDTLGKTIGATSPLPKREQRIPDTVTIDEIKTRLEISLREAGRLRTALEQRTHLNFKITQDLRLIVDLGDSSSTSKS